MLAEMAQQSAADFDARGLATVMLDLSLLQQWEPLRVLSHKFSERIWVDIWQFSGWDLTNALYACHFLVLQGDVEVGRIFVRVASELARCSHQYWVTWKGQDLANTMFAFMKWGKRDPHAVDRLDVLPFVEGILQATVDQVSSLQAEEFINVLEGVKAFGLKSRLFEQLGTAAKRVLDSARGWHEMVRSPDLLSRLVAMMAEILGPHITGSSQERATKSTWQSNFRVSKSEKDFF